MKQLEATIRYCFANPDYLSAAMTHSSYANEYPSQIQNNERLEFLGDAVLSFIVSDYIFKQCKVAEGELSKIRASLVCESALGNYAKSIRLGNYLQLGKGEEKSGGRERVSILADAFEALIAAIYLDGGVQAASGFVLPFIMESVETATGDDLNDYKTRLQEIAQKNEEHVSYVLINESGPEHDKCFEVEVRLNSNVIGMGKGKSKKVAEQNAAQEALRLMGVL